MPAIIELTEVIGTALNPVFGEPKAMMPVEPAIVEGSGKAADEAMPNGAAEFGKLQEF